MWIIAFTFTSHTNNQRFEDTANRAQQIAVFFERHTIGVFQYGDAYLKQVRREYLRNYNLTDVEGLMSEVPLSDSIASHVTITDEKGTPILVSGLQIKPGTTTKDRGYFKFQKNSQGDELFISKSHLGRNSGKLIVRLVRRYNRPNGEFGGVMFIALEEKHITEFFNTMNIGPKSSATLVGEDKNIRARSSYGKIGHGQNISGSRIWKELEQSPVGLYRQTSVVDNITRYYAYRRIPKFPLIVAIGMSVDDLDQKETKSDIYDFSVALLATLLIVITAVFLCRQQNLMVEIESKNIELGKRNEEIQAKNSELENQNAELESFTYTVSHDLKSPLVTINGFLGLLRKDIKHQDQAAVNKDLDQIESAASRMARLLEELLQLSRVGHQIGKSELISLTGLVKEAANQVSILFEKQGVELDVDANMPEVFCDSSRLLEVYQNLIENSLKFMGDQASPRIAIGAQRKNDEVRCYLRDNGIGIKKEFHELVFNLFDRLDPDIDGTGIGLALVKRIIEVHGGRIWVESEGEAGLGSTFWFTLPAGENKIAPA